ncbi:MAG: Undecaprenyl phosphate-alpha-4-amino-4-deoxy-L-arabinose arabinosyl transferase [Planctomycetota bacterium]
MEASKFTCGNPFLERFREKTFWVLVLLLTLGLFPRLGILTMRGEETRRALVAFEMRYFDDYITPREQGLLFQSNPPLSSWMMLGSSILFGNYDPYSVRFPSAVAVLLTSVLIYVYARNYFSQAGAFASAVAFATNGEIMIISQKAEPEAVYILFLSASLILWHWGYERKWPSVLTWISAGVFVGLASLCKGGLQPLAYFCASVFFYLLYCRNLSYLFTLPMLAGLSSTIVVVAAWMVPYIVRHGASEAKALWLNDTASRFHSWNMVHFFKHLGSFPFEVFGSILPWSVLFLAYLLPSFRGRLSPYKPLLFFALFACGFAFLTIWIPPGGQTRYFATLYPMLALFMGTVAEVAFVATESTARKPWIRFNCLIAASFILIGIAIALLPFKIPGITFSRWTLPTPSTVFYGMSFVVIGVWIMIGRQRILLSLGVMTVGLLVFNLGYFMDVKVQRSERTLEEMARIKSHLPPDVSLVSLGITNHKFTYYYGKFITPLPVDSDGKGVTYFCFDPCLIDVTKITFPWKQIDTFSLTRDLLDQKRHVVLAKKNDG